MQIEVLVGELDEHRRVFSGAGSNIHGVSAMPTEFGVDDLHDLRHFGGVVELGARAAGVLPAAAGLVLDEWILKHGKGAICDVFRCA